MLLVVIVEGSDCVGRNGGVCFKVELLDLGGLFQLAHDVTLLLFIRRVWAFHGLEHAVAINLEELLLRRKRLDAG